MAMGAEPLSAAAGPVAMRRSFPGKAREMQWCKAVGWLALALACLEARAAQLSQAALALPGITPGCSDPAVSPAVCWQGDAPREPGAWTAGTASLCRHPKPTAIPLT